MACGICGDTGHNRRTHRSHPAPQGEALLDQLALPAPVVYRPESERSARQEALREAAHSEPAGSQREQAERAYTDAVQHAAEDAGRGQAEREIAVPGGTVPERIARTHFPELLPTDGVPFTPARVDPGHEWVIRPPWRTELGPDGPLKICLPGIYQLTADQYHDPAVTGDWVSNSDGRLLTPPKAPAQFRYDKDHGVRKTSEAFDFGHVAHAVVLGRGEEYQVFGAKVDGRTREGKAQKADVDAARAAGKTPIYAEQWETISAMVEALVADEDADALLAQPGRAEACMFWAERIRITDPGNALVGQVVTVRRRAMVDLLPDPPPDPESRLVVVDYKTAEDSTPDDGMSKRIYDHAYHRQGDTIRAGVRALYGRDAAVVFLIQSKHPPHLIVIVDLDANAQRIGAIENRQALEVWAECVATGVWPGHAKGVTTMPVPAWIENRYDDEIVIT